MSTELFTGLTVTDHAAGVAWCESLLGRKADFEPHDTESVWTLEPGRHLYVLERPERAGGGLVTLFVEDYEGFLANAAGRGVEPETEETYDNGVRKATFRDPDGNEVGVAG